MCKIYKEGYYIRWDEEQCLIFANKAGREVQAEEVQGIIEILFTKGILDRNSYQENGILTSESIQKVWMEATKRRKRELSELPYLKVKPEKENGKADTPPALQEIQQPELFKKVREIVKSNKSAKQDSLIRQLNPVIRGWVNNQRFVVSAEAFSKIDYQIYNCLWQWAKRRHKKKSRRWIAKKYWHRIGSRNWTFAAEERSKKRNKELSYFALEYATDTKIIRFKKIVAEANPFDARWNGYY